MHTILRGNIHESSELSFRFMQLFEWTAAHLKRRIVELKCAVCIMQI